MDKQPRAVQHAAASGTCVHALTSCSLVTHRRTAVNWNWRRMQSGLSGETHVDSSFLSFFHLNLNPTVQGENQIADITPLLAVMIG